MGNRITFRERGGDGSEALAGAVSVSEPRIKFLKGWETGTTDPGDGSVECGAGTPFPMEVTRDQLSEIYYRIRDAWFTSGSIAYDGYTTLTIQNTPPAALASYATFGSGDTRIIRGYTTTQTLGGHDDAQFAAAYTVDGVDYRDADQEYGMWSEAAFPFAGQTAFSHFVVSIMDTGPSLGGNYGVLIDGSDVLSRIGLDLSGKVAYIGDHPFAAGSRLFLGISFYVEGEFTIPAVTNQAELIGGGATPALSGGYLKLSLASGIVSCPIYYDDGYILASITDWVITAQSWWPYKTTVGAAAWDTTTGAPANGGPGA